MTSEAQKMAKIKYDKDNFCYQTIKVKKTLLKNFRAACAVNGDKVNSVLREAMENYVAVSAFGQPSNVEGGEMNE